MVPPDLQVDALELPPSGNKKLVLVAHGWAGFPEPTPQQASVNDSWVTTMANDIANRLGPTSGWDVTPCLWIPDSITIIPDDALAYAAGKGVDVGNMIYERGYQEIHLIAHSAGSNLIENAIQRIRQREAGDGRAACRIHATFLDAYVGLLFDGKFNYGIGADWAEQYCAHDEFDPWTDSILTHAYNFYVTLLDPLLIPPDMSRHEWPHIYYDGTVTAPAKPVSDYNYGFPLSDEAGWWNPSIYPIDQDAFFSPGPNGTVLISAGWDEVASAHAKAPEPLPISIDAISGVIKGNVGNVTASGNTLTLQSDPTADATIPVPIASSTNALCLKVTFVAARGSWGRLSITWNGT